MITGDVLFCYPISLKLRAILLNKYESTWMAQDLEQIMHNDLDIFFHNDTFIIFQWLCYIRLSKTDLTYMINSQSVTSRRLMEEWHST